MKVLQLIERLKEIAEASGKNFEVELAIEKGDGFLPFEIEEVQVTGTLTGLKTIWLKG